MNLQMLAKWNPLTITVAQKGHTKLAFTDSTFFKRTFSELDVSNFKLDISKIFSEVLYPVDGEAVPLAWGLLHAPT